jgi:hypothetical protein
MVTWAWLRSSHGWHKFQQSCAGTLSPPPSPAAGAWPCLCLPLHLDLPPPLFSHWVSTSTAGGDLGREGQGRQEWVHPTLPYFPHSPARPSTHHTHHTHTAHCPPPQSTWALTAGAASRKATANLVPSFQPLTPLCLPALGWKRNTTPLVHLLIFPVKAP